LVKNSYEFLKIAPALARGIFIIFFNSLAGISGGISGPNFAICDRNIAASTGNAKQAVDQPLPHAQASQAEGGEDRSGFAGLN
jgi:hypothetical protein